MTHHHCRLHSQNNKTTELNELYLQPDILWAPEKMSYMHILVKYKDLEYALLSIFIILLFTILLFFFFFCVNWELPWKIVLVFWYHYHSAYKLVWWIKLEEDVVCRVLYYSDTPFTLVCFRFNLHNICYSFAYRLYNSGVFEVENWNYYPYTKKKIRVWSIKLWKLSNNRFGQSRFCTNK